MKNKKNKRGRTSFNERNHHTTQQHRTTIKESSRSQIKKQDKAQSKARTG
jgi:hypothetical protein